MKISKEKKKTQPHTVSSPFSLSLLPSPLYVHSQWNHLIIRINRVISPRICGGHFFLADFVLGFCLPCVLPGLSHPQLFQGLPTNLFGQIFSDLSRFIFLWPLMYCAGSFGVDEVVLHLISVLRDGAIWDPVIMCHGPHMIFLQH